MNKKGLGKQKIKTDYKIKTNKPGQFSVRLFKKTIFTFNKLTKEREREATPYDNSPLGHMSGADHKKKQI